MWKRGEKVSWGGRGICQREISQLGGWLQKRIAGRILLEWIVVMRVGTVMI